MGGQRNRPQMQQENSPEELDEMEASNLSDRVFRVMIINHKNNQSEIKNVYL